MTTLLNFPISEAESQTIFRALLEYRKALALSHWAENPIVDEEIQRADAISERISLASYYPIAEEASE